MQNYVPVTIEIDNQALSVLLDRQTRIADLNIWLWRLGAKRVTIGSSRRDAPQTPALVRKYGCSVSSFG